MRKRSSLLVPWLCSMACFASGADIYVSADRQRCAAGTSSAPLQTIAAARDKADGVKAGGPVTVHLLPGTYYLTSRWFSGRPTRAPLSAPIT